MGEEVERESGGGTGTVVLVCFREKYGYPESKRSESASEDSGYISRGKSVEDEEVMHDEMIDQVLKALEALPPRSREVLECVHLKNMKYAEVAELLGISVATVKTLLVRSLKTLRGLVSDTALLLLLVYR